LFALIPADKTSCGKVRENCAPVENCVATHEIKAVLLFADCSENVFYLMQISEIAMNPLNNGVTAEIFLDPCDCSGALVLVSTDHDDLRLG
jgi:hypothetical protein